MPKIALFFVTHFETITVMMTNFFEKGFTLLSEKS